MNVGIPDSFRDVFYTHYLTTVRKLQGLIGDPHAAEDLAQEAFLRLYRHPPDDMTYVGAWLHRTAIRLGYDYLNQAKRREIADDAARAEFDVGVSGLAPASEEEAIHRLDRELVKMALSNLRDRDRQLLLLRHSGYSYREIADVLSVNAATVGTMVARATERFKREYLHEEETSCEEKNQGTSSKESSG